MLRETNTNSGFTIIEVVITIAIGAAVMALVLNAVAGARRSQRNNARTADINQVAAAANQYIAARNKLPTKWDDIDENVGDSTFGHYQWAAISIPVAGWDTGKPAANGDFLVSASSGTNAITIDPTAGTCSDITYTTESTCSGAGETWTPNTGQPSTTLITSIGANTTGAADQFHLVREAGCNQDGSAVVDGGIRELTIVYRLEGQDQISCLEI